MGTLTHQVPFVGQYHCASQTHERSRSTQKRTFEGVALDLSMNIDIVVNYRQQHEPFVQMDQ